MRLKFGSPGLEQGGGTQNKYTVEFRHRNRARSQFEMNKIK